VITGFWNDNTFTAEIADKIDFSGFPNGIYYYTLMLDVSSLKTGKLIFQDNFP